MNDFVFIHTFQEYFDGSIQRTFVNSNVTPKLTNLQRSSNSLLGKAWILSAGSNESFTVNLFLVRGWSKIDKYLAIP